MKFLPMNCTNKECSVIAYVRKPEAFHSSFYIISFSVKITASQSVSHCRTNYKERTQEKEQGGKRGGNGLILLWGQNDKP